MALPQPHDAAASLVASGSETRLIRCSQCKTFKRPISYPLRLVNLEPYHVCLTHKWYWTPAKQAQNWAPSETKSIEQVASEAAQLLEGTPAAQTSWMLDGDERDLAAFSSRIAAAGDWKSTEVATRQRKKEKATEAQPSPMFAYNLVSRDPPRSAAGGFRLTFYVHPGTGKVTVTMKPEGKVAASPWSRPKRWRKKDDGSRSASEGATEVPPPAQAAESAGLEDDGDFAAQRYGHSDTSRFAAALEAAAAAVGATDHNLPPQSDPYAIMDHPALTSSLGHSDRDVMPPPPLPATRPAKRARRVEPQLVSPMPTYNSDTVSTSTNPAFAASTAPDWTRFLSFPTLTLPEGDIPIDPLLMSSPGDGPAPATKSRKQPASPRKRSSHGPPPPPPPNRPLTLAEMLSSSLFEPPDLGIPTRSTTVAGSGTQHLHSWRQEASPKAGTSAETAGQNAASSAATALATQELVSALTSLRDGIYARTTGHSPAASATVSTPVAAVPPESPAGEDERDEEGYYEDSIPDTSSEEEDDEDDAGGDASDMSSFFESSDEGGGSGGDDNWLEGFAAQQMGLRTRTAPDRAVPIRVSSARSDRASRRSGAQQGGDRQRPHEVDELDDRDTPHSRTPSMALATPSEEIDELDSQAGSEAEA